MTWVERFSFFSTPDIVALTVLAIVWLGSSRIIEHPPKSRPSVSMLMADYRRTWMTAFVQRDPRIFDAQIVASLRQGTAFFASASMIAIGGGFALIGNADLLRGVTEDLTHDSDPAILLELKLVLLLIFATNAFLKFVWSHRLFGYCSVLMAAVPNEVSDLAYARAAKAGEINVFAARGYNRGLRSVYFGIAASAWLLGAVPLMAATVFTVLVILRREFASNSRQVLLETTDR
ncbi:DUF599 domain-containing protein [Mesobacterium sp. TK19101]|uniref:DUF599 domain-containing protein n=1 Tax=Mesobacterium hydrothermale TaxID=3111907 RepID=A0ABU6HFZ2_9RHOB|nr:DUF599 domain-containing protein [Mesobacterium sp. TK19101]MEC3861378.1 DUF599 domain-containing protein [Mesobacterium sp. TK19101]